MVGDGKEMVANAERAKQLSTSPFITASQWGQASSQPDQNRLDVLG